METPNASVQGIGGVFIYSNDAARLADWYRTVLGIALERHPDGDKFYKVFFTRDFESSIVRGNPVFAIYQAQGALTPSGRGFMLNLRVVGLVELLAQLRAQGVEVESKAVEWERGKHAWIRDGDGNRVELYEELFPDAG